MKNVSTSVTPDDFNAVAPADLLDILRSLPRLDAFHLLLYEQLQGTDVRTLHPCGLAYPSAPCESICTLPREQALQEAVSTGQPVIFTCPMGLLNFTLAIDFDLPSQFCLIAGGIRDAAEPDLAPLPPGLSPDSELLEALQNLPRLDRQEVEAVAAEVHRLLPGFFTRNLHSFTLEKILRRARAVAEVGREIEAASAPDQLISTLCESAVLLFDAPRVAVALAEGDGGRLRLRGGLGLPPASGESVPDGLKAYLQRHPAPGPVPPEEAALLFPQAPAAPVHCLPLAGGGEEAGVLILFGVDLQPRDLLLLDLLAGRAAARLCALRREEEFAREKETSGRLLTMISALARLETTEELHFSMVEMAADLLQAASGSLMLLDASGESLRIEAAKGMNLPLARSMSVRLGTGIAGKVAKSGFPLLVNDIEKDSRVAATNRPRFRTKSFLSVPLRPKGEVIGVLNLADKEGQASFGEADLHLLTSFATHAGILLERSAALERATRLEELSVTDPLTRLYNRRFLEQRMEEELNRSCRQNLQFTLIMVDLDNFKLYNDACGHVAGDNALRRVAQLLRASAREMDIVTRYGGEEFCLVLPGTSKKESMFVAERVRRAIEKEPFPMESCLPQKHLTASLGLASYPEDGSTASTLVHAADVALYQAKKEGRNRLVIYDPARNGTASLPVHSGRGCA